MVRASPRWKQRWRLVPASCPPPSIRPLPFASIVYQPNMVDQSKLNQRYRVANGFEGGAAPVASETGVAPPKEQELEYRTLMRVLFAALISIPVDDFQLPPDFIPGLREWMPMGSSNRTVWILESVSRRCR